MHNPFMNQIKYQWLGVAVLGAYAFGSLANLSSLFHLLPLNYGSLLFLLAFVAATFLAEIWAVMFWKASRTRLSTSTLLVTNVILICNLISLMPEFRIISNRLLG